VKIFGRKKPFLVGMTNQIRNAPVIGLGYKPLRKINGRTRKE